MWKPRPFLTCMWFFTACYGLVVKSFFWLQIQRSRVRFPTPLEIVFHLGLQHRSNDWLLWLVRVHEAGLFQFVTGSALFECPFFLYFSGKPPTFIFMCLTLLVQCTFNNGNRQVTISHPALKLTCRLATPLEILFHVYRSEAHRSNDLSPNGARCLFFFPDPPYIVGHMIKLNLWKVASWLW
jgi:hypothetical protein